MTNSKFHADEALDQISEIMIVAGFFCCDDEKNRATYARIHLVIWKAIHDAMELQPNELIDQFAEMLVRDRAEREERGSRLWGRMIEPSRF